jgi:RsmE family RNA methyltransferase
MGHALQFAMFIFLFTTKSALSSFTFHPTTQVIHGRLQTFITRKYHTSTVLGLNRFLFDPSELEIQVDTSVDTTPSIILPKGDYRTIHAAKILGLQNGDTLRAGIVQDSYTRHSILQPSIRSGEANQFSGCITDEATIEWLPEGKVKKPQPTKNGDPPGSLQITLHSLRPITQEISEMQPRISLLLALPRPLVLGRLLPMIAQMGVQDLILTQAEKVPKDYFGSHLLRQPMEIRKGLIEGLCQAADVQIPSVRIVKQLKPFMEDELDELFPRDQWARVIAHPQRKNGKPALRMGEISFPSTTGIKDDERRILLAVGPEGGWSEPHELDLFQKCGFQQVTLGPRILRSDVAVISLLSLAVDAVAS